MKTSEELKKYAISRFKKKHINQDIMVMDHNKSYMYVKIKGTAYSNGSRDYIPVKHLIVNHNDGKILFEQEGGKIYNPKLTELRKKYKLEI